MHGDGGRGGSAHTLAHTPGQAHEGPPPGAFNLADPVSRKTPGSGPTGPRPPPQTVQDCTRRGRRGNPEGERRGAPRGVLLVPIPPIPPAGSRKSLLQVPPVKQTPRRGTGRQARAPATPTPASGPRPPTWWRASSTVSASGRLCSSIPATWAALCAHFGPRCREVARLGWGRSGRGRTGPRGLGGTQAPSSTAEQEYGVVCRRGRKAAGRRGAEPAATPTPQDARQVAPGPRADGAARRMAPRRREPRAAPRSPARARAAAAARASRPPAGTIFPPARAPGSRWASAKLCLGPMLIRQCPDGAGRSGGGRRPSPPPAPPRPRPRPARACALPPRRGRAPRAENKSGGAEGCKLVVWGTRSNTTPAGRSEWGPRDTVFLFAPPSETRG